MPRRSSGCEKCRQRKVRCDERRPRCKRCTDYGIVCPGYRPTAENDHHFVDQTQYAALKSGSLLVEAESPSSTRVDKSAGGYRWHHQAFDGYKPSSLTKMNNQNLHRVQLLSTFLDLYLPKQHDAKILSHFLYLSHLTNVDLAAPLLQISVDTLCLVEIGSLYQDQRLLRETRSKYVRALPMLSRELAKPQRRQMPKDHILAAIIILALCELFDGIADGSKDGKGWISHVNGALQFVKAIGPDVLATPFGQLLYHQVRHSTICMGLKDRTSVFLAEPQWLKLTEELALVDPMTALHDCIVQIPGVLKRCDAIVILEQRSSDAASVREDLIDLRLQLSAWYSKWHEMESKLPVNTVNIQQMTEFTALVPDRTFQTAFAFESVEICCQLQLFWTGCIMLDFTLLELRQRFPETIPHMSSVPQQGPVNHGDADLKRELYVTATSICRSLPFCYQAEVGSVGRMGSFLVRIVEAYFEHTGHCPELEWCRAVRRSLTSSYTHGSDDKTTAQAAPKPWEVEHRCKSPVCNFTIECLAPAPMSLEGHYPTITYQPRGDFTERATDKEKKLLFSAHLDEALNQKNPHQVKFNGASALADERIVTAGFEPRLMLAT